MNEDLKSMWQELIIDIIKDKKNDVAEDLFQSHIISSFRLLGWSLAYHEICPKERINIGANNQIEPDITIKLAGKPVMVIEVKRPNNTVTQRQEEQLLSYMRILALPVGIYFGHEIRFYYDTGNDSPQLVWTCELNSQAENGPQFVEFVKKSTFSQERILNYSKEKSKTIHSTAIMNQFSQGLQENADSIIKALLTDYFVQSKRCNKDIVSSILNSYVFSIDKEQCCSAVDISHPTGIMLAETNNGSRSKRDTTKYSIDGGKTYLGKGKIVSRIVKLFMEKNPDVTFEQLRKAFPDNLQGSYGVVRSLEQIELSKQNHKDLSRRYVMNEQLLTADGKIVVVSNQWGQYNFANVLNLISRWGWDILSR
ncbi:MAG: hypothetical protein PUF62_09650 [Bacteroidales bacterium]|nr:hypothetical protein [Bacteroidales bacterium]